jgi:hypothetical protein
VSIAPAAFVLTSRSEVAQDTCTAPANWFPVVEQPVDFPVDDNCSFHQWAWQEFLWLAQLPGDGSAEANFLGLAYPSDLFVANPAPYPGRPTGAALLRVLPRDVKDDEHLDVEAITQAGSGDVLIDQAGNVVFYSVLIDSTWYNFARSNGFNVPATLLSAPDTLNFPTDGPGSLELKTAWRVAVLGDSTYIPNAATRFFTTQGYVPAVRIDSGKIVPDTTAFSLATLALVGMHVVGTVPGHPEFIWASFEHVDNAPPCAATPAPASGPGGGAWSLYPAGLSCPVDANGNAAPCNVGHGGQPVTSFAPTPVCQVNPWGGAPGSDNAANIQSINASVAAQLPPAKAVLANYVLVGGQWTSPGGLPATSGTNTNIHGSPLLANTSMESFTQAYGTTCFSCHNPSPGAQGFSGKNLSVSHVWPPQP